MTTTTNVTGAELRARRKAAGLTQAQLARAADCSLSIIGHFEAGAIPKRSLVLSNVLAALTAREDWLARQETPAAA